MVRTNLNSRHYSDDNKITDKNVAKEAESGDNKNVIPKPGKKKFKKAMPITKVGNLEAAAEDVAHLISQKGGEKKEMVQAELLSKLLGHINATGEQKSAPEMNLR